MTGSLTLARCGRGVRTIGRVAAAVMVMHVAIGARVDAQGQMEPIAHVTQVEGPLPRHALRTLLGSAPLFECQSTFMGGMIHMRVHVETSGALVVDDARANPEVRGYIRCLRRVFGRLHVAPQPAETRARVMIEFIACGDVPPD